MVCSAENQLETMVAMRFALSVMTLLAIASPASAHWQFTAWGMSREQVAGAAHGNATGVDPSTRGSVDGDKILLEAPYTAGTFNFTAGFGFDSMDHLDRVHLVLQSGDAVALRAGLVKKYGDPKHEDSDFDAFGGSIIWVTTDETIILSQSDSNAPGVTPTVTLDYIRLNNASDEGL